MLMFIEMEFIYEGYEVDVVYDGRDVLRKVENLDYSLILMDIMILSLNGIEVCRRIR